MFGSSEEAKKAGWFSRRHQTDVVHLDSTHRRRDRKAQRREEAEGRQDRWDNMTLSERLQQKIDQGNGDTVEATVLRILIEEAKK